jgi:phosphoenolpyruvate-protein kinase (PTS system EI component)
MATTTERPLPMTVGDLVAWLPPAPTDTTVTRAAEALDRISAALAAVTAELAALDTADRAAATQLADAAERGAAELGKAIVKIGADNRPVLERHRSLLSRTWQALNERHSHAEATDPRHVAWREQCESILAEFSRVMSMDAEPRFAALVDLTRRIG